MNRIDRRTKIIIIEMLICFSLFATTATHATTCDWVYDEFDSLMNKQFLLSPDKYVPVVKNRLSRRDYHRQKRADFLFRGNRKNSGVAIVRTSSNRWGKVLFSWERKSKKSPPVLTIKESVLYGRVKDGFRPVTRRNPIVRSSFMLDLDSGKVGAKGADLWFHNIDGKQMFIEARNGAQIMFPMASLCSQKVQQNMARVMLPKAPVLIPSDHLSSTNPVPSSGMDDEEGTKTVVDRAILANGNTLISYSDGSKMENFKGGMIRHHADGSPPTTLLFSTAIPFAVPVAEPGSSEETWLQGHSNSLHNTLITLVGDRDSVDRALENLDTSGNPYDSVAIRSDLIQQLVSP